MAGQASNYPSSALIIPSITFLPFEPQPLPHSVAQDGIETSTAQLALGSPVFMGLLYVQISKFFSCSLPYVHIIIRPKNQKSRMENFPSIYSKQVFSLIFFLETGKPSLTFHFHTSETDTFLHSKTDRSESRINEDGQQILISGRQGSYGVSRRLDNSYPISRGMPQLIIGNQNTVWTDDPFF